MRVLVCGSRTFSDAGTVFEVLQGVYALHELGFLTAHTDDVITVVHGDAKGADTLAKGWARGGIHPGDTTLGDSDRLSVVEDPHPADWKTHHPDWCPGDFCVAKRDHCPTAGPRRNQEMLDSGVDRVIAFVDKPLPKSRGTADMVQRAEKIHIPTMVVRAS